MIIVAPLFKVNSNEYYLCMLLHSKHLSSILHARHTNAHTHFVSSTYTGVFSCWWDIERIKIYISYARLQTKKQWCWWQRQKRSINDIYIVAARTHKKPFIGWFTAEHNRNQWTNYYSRRKFTRPHIIYYTISVHTTAENVSRNDEREVMCTPPFTIWVCARINDVAGIKRKIWSVCVCVYDGRAGVQAFGRSVGWMLANASVHSIVLVFNLLNIQLDLFKFFAIDALR